MTSSGHVTYIKETFLDPQNALLASSWLNDFRVTELGCPYRSYNIKESSSQNNAWHETFAGVEFFGLAVFCILRELFFFFAIFRKSRLFELEYLRRFFFITPHTNLLLFRLTPVCNYTSSVPWAVLSFHLKRRFK